MTSSQNRATEAILYIPGITGQSIDDAAFRIASAFNACSVTAAAEFPVSAGQDEDYVSIGVELKTRIRTIQRTEPGAEPQNIIDVFEFNYVDSLIREHAESNLAVKSLRLFVQIFVNIPRMISAFVGRKQKSFKEKAQFIYATIILAMLVVYFFVLVAAVYTTIDQVISSRNTPVPQAAVSATENINVSLVVQGSRTPQQEGGSGVNVSQLLIILIAAIEAFYPGLKKRLSDASARYTSLLEYLSFGARGHVLEGQLIAILDHIETKGYENIHVIAYSFGSVLAIDNIFPAGRMPAERIKGIRTLATVGCPYDLIRVFWPDYYTERFVASSVIENWINIYSPIDVLGSNFRNDSMKAEPEIKDAISSGNDQNAPLLPRTSLAWATARPMKGLSWPEFFALAGLQAHNSYWEQNYESEYTAFSLIITEIYKDNKILR